MERKGITKINDLISNLGNFKNIQEINEQFGSRFNVLDLYSIKSAIPTKWKQLITNENSIAVPQPELRIKINKTNKPINVLLNKEIYWELIEKQRQRPTAIEKWEEMYYYVNFEWDYIFTLPYRIARETYLQSLQFQILHRYFPCASNVHIWYPHEQEKCNHCDTDDTLEHYFSECKKVKPFWSWFRRWINSIYGCNIMYCTLDIIFGIPNLNESTMLDVINFCILLAKYFIKKCKYSNVDIIEVKYKSLLKERLSVEKLLLTEENRENVFYQKWEDIYRSL